MTVSAKACVFRLPLNSVQIQKLYSDSVCRRSKLLAKLVAGYVAKLASSSITWDFQQHRTNKNVFL